MEYCYLGACVHRNGPLLLHSQGGSRIQAPTCWDDREWEQQFTQIASNELISLSFC